MPRGTLWLPLAALLLTGCPFDKKPTSQDLSRHKVRQLAFWEDRLAMPLHDRVGEAPAALIEYLAMDNEVNGFAGRATAAPLAPAMAADVKAVLEVLPPKFKGMLQEKLLGVFVVSGLGSSAYTDFVRDAQNAPVAAFVVIDVEAMKRKANDWFTWKENSPFTPDPAWRLAATIADPAGDTERGALEFVLIHEFGHVVAFDEDVHPLWSLAPKLVDPSDYPFLNLAWTVEDGRYTRKIEKTALLPGPIIYYKPSVDRPKATAMLSYYDWLGKSDFVTLYAATNPFDDFADSLVSYVHTVLLRKPFEIRIFENNTLRRTVHACWDEPRCAEKRKLLEEFLR